MPPELRAWLDRPTVAEADRNASRPDFQRMVYIYRAATYIRWPHALVWIPAGWLVVDRLDRAPD